MPPPAWDPPGSSLGKKKPPALLILAIVALPCLCCPILGAILFPVFAQARDAARHTQNALRMRNILNGVLSYAHKNEGRLPPMGTYTDFEAAVGPEILGKNPCRDIQGGPFYLNVRLSKQLLSTIKVPSKTPFLREPPVRRASTVRIVFMDGHLEKYLSNAEAIRIWQRLTSSPE